MKPTLSSIKKLCTVQYGYTNGEFWQKNYEEYDYYRQRRDELKSC